MKPVILCILDGWGVGPSSPSNGISLASTPVWDRFIRTCPHSILEASEISVGLPKGQMGNSEVGHMTIGLGRVILQDLPLIDQSISDGSLEKNPSFRQFSAMLKASGGACHLFGLLSPGGVHSHQNHIIALAKLLDQQGIPVWIHAALDGRDTPPQSGREYMENFLKTTEACGHVKIATLGGRYFYMDRDKRWDRTSKAYHAMVNASGVRFSDPCQIITDFYSKEITDEFIPPCVSTHYQGYQGGDGLLFANFRADRVRQLLASLIDSDFNQFDRGQSPSFASIVMMTEYSEDLAKKGGVLFPKPDPSHSLGEEVSLASFHQFRIAETEKYAHVTFFLNGGREECYKGEERKLISSSDVATYDLKPEMSAYEVTECLVSAMKTGKYQLYVVNYANPDMVGHTGVQQAIIKAIEVVDGCLGKIERTALEQDITLLITADHGNCEEMWDPKHQAPLTSHTLNPVPFVMVNGPNDVALRHGGLSDIAPTILTLLNINIPTQMTGKSLIVRKGAMVAS